MTYEEYNNLTEDQKLTIEFDNWAEGEYDLVWNDFSKEVETL
jgi:hypothetical protein